MNEFVDLSKIVEVFDATLLISIVVVWREWRKAEAKVVELLQKQINDNATSMEKYYAFENVLRGLTDIIKRS